MPRTAGTSVRFSETAKKLLPLLAEHHGLNQTAVLEMLIRDAARKAKIEIPKEN